MNDRNHHIERAEYTAKLKAEIERLTDELINVEQLAKDRYCNMQIEIERLRADKTKWILRCGIVDAENKRLRAELKATQDNEHRIVEANKLVLIRNAKLQAVVDAAISWANTDQNDIDGCDKTTLELLDAVLEYEMSVAALDTVDEKGQTDD